MDDGKGKENFKFRESGRWWSTATEQSTEKEKEKDRQEKRKTEICRRQSEDEESLKRTRALKKPGDS